MTPLLAPQHGHFRFESGHHSSQWMDLETLFLQPAHVEPLADELAQRLAKHNVEVVCGPLVEGAFLALMVARQLGVPFTYSERIETRSDALYPIAYRVPRALHYHVRGKRVAIVNDVISAGSAVGRTAVDLDACGATMVAIAALLILGDWTVRFAADRNIAVEALEERPLEIWTPEECPLCARGVALSNVREVDGQQ